MYPARVELMETAERFVDSRGVRPLVISEFDTSGESSVSRTSTRSTVGGAAMEFEMCKKNRDGLTDESAIGDQDEALMGTVIPHSLSLADDFSEVQEDSDAES